MSEAEKKQSMENGSEPLPVIPDRREAELLPLRVKLQAVIGMEKAIFPLFFGGMLVLIAGVMLGGGRHGRQPVVGYETMLLIVAGAGVLFLLAGVLWFAVDNYYVIDRQSRRILLHKGLRFSGDDFPFLDFGQVSAIGLNCSPRQGKYGQVGWTYTPVLLTKDERVIELSETETGMNCEKLPELNLQTRRWAAALQCRWIECPGRRAFDADDFICDGKEELESERT